MSRFCHQVTAKTYFEHGTKRLESLCNILGLNQKTQQITDIFQSFSSSWGNRAIGDVSSWLSDVGEDHTPFEISIAFDEDNPELRILTEVQGSTPNLQSNWEAGLRFNSWLQENFNVSLDRFHEIANLYSPKNPEAKFSIWHAVGFKPNKDPAFKIYLNPHAQGKSLVAAIIEESLVRLGFSYAWPKFADITARRGFTKDEFTYFSLDLSADKNARVKIYLRHYDATTEDIEKTLSNTSNYVKGDATELCQSLSDFEDSFSGKPVISCFSLTDAAKNTLPTGTFDLPISNYAANDSVIQNRLHNYFIKYNLLTSAYDSVIQAISQVPLNTGIGLHSYISLRRVKQKHRVTIYFGLESYQVPPPNKLADAQTEQLIRSPEQIVSYYEHDTIVNHPFLQRLQREPINLSHLWILFANVHVGIATNFTRRLGSLINQIEDEEIRCILVKQLNDELGNGDSSQIHRKLFVKFMNAIDAWQPKNITDNLLIPGHELNNSLAAIFSDSNPYVGLGASILMEIYGKQFDQCMAKLFRTQKSVDISSLIWLTMHEELETDHANEALNLALLVPKSQEILANVELGFEKIYRTSWQFFNDLYNICFI